MQIPTTDPTSLIQMRDSIYATDLLITAIGKLDFFTWLSGNPATSKKIAQAFHLDPRPTDVMLTLFKSYDLVYEEDKKFHLSKLAEEHLTSHSPFSLVPYYAIQAERPIVDKMLEVLKTGEPANWGGKMEEEEWIKAMEKPEFADKFTAAMNSRGAYLAPLLAKSFDFSKYNYLLDVAGGSGIYAAAVVNEFSNIKAAVFERSPVDQIAKRSLIKLNVEAKVSVIEGDMFKDPLPTGFDVHLISHVIHDWNPEQNKIIIKNSFESLNKGGIIMIVDAHLNEDMSGPVPVAEYSVLLMFSTPGKCYSITEMRKLLKEAGFSDIHYLPLKANRSLIIGKK